MDSHAVLRLTETDAGGNSTELATVEVSNSTITIGRSNEADICFGEDDQSVSRHQFEVSLNGGAPTLKNIGRNPIVYKNGKKQLAPGAQVNIVSGLEVSFRESKLRFDVEVPEVYCLKTKGAGGRATFEIESNRKYTVGRNPECDITLDSSGVSRQHCRIQVTPAAILKVHDLGSVNGIRICLKGELQPEDSDIEVPCGVKFIIGDIECVLEKKGQGSGQKKWIALPVAFLLLLLVASASYFVLKPDGQGKSTGGSKDSRKTDLPHVDKPFVREVPDQPQPSSLPKPSPAKKSDQERQKKIDRVHAIVRADISFDKKAEQFAQLAKNPELKSLRALCRQLAEYYSRCSAVEKLNNSLSEEFEQWKEEIRSSIKQLKFDFDTTLSLKRLKSEVNRLDESYKTVSTLMQDHGIEGVESPDELTVIANDLIEQANKYGKNARSLSFVWTDLEDSSFAPKKFDKETIMLSAEALYPGEDIGSEVCSKIEEIINYQEQVSVAYRGLIGQLGSLLTNYTENGVSEQLLPERVAMKPLRDAIGAPLPKYFEEPPPITRVSSNLYTHLEAISPKWTNLGFLTYCGRWKSDLEQKKSVFAEEAVPLVGQLCAEASLKCAADLDEGMEPYKTIKGRLESGGELGLNDANKLMGVYNFCRQYGQNKLFCELQEESKNNMGTMRADVLGRLCEWLDEECSSGQQTFDDSKMMDCLKRAEDILKVLDDAVYLPPDVNERIKINRAWVEGKKKKIKIDSGKW